MSNISDFIGSGSGGASIAVNELGLVSGSVDLELNNYGVFEAEANDATTFNITGLSSTGRKTGWLTLSSTDFNNVSFSSNVKMQPLKSKINLSEFGSVVNTSTSIVGNVAKFSKDGKYVITTSFNDSNYYQYVLSTPWDITTLAAYGSSGFLGGPSDHTIAYNESGRFIYRIGSFDVLEQYSVETPYDPTNSATTLIGSIFGLGLYGVETSGTPSGGISVSPDGKILLVGVDGSTNGYINMFIMKNPHDLSEISHVGAISLDVKDFLVINEGRTIIAVDVFSRILQYDLSTPWDITTATNTGKRLDLSGTTTVIEIVGYNEDTGSLYILDEVDGVIKQFDSSPNSGTRMYYMDQLSDTNVLLTPYAFNGV